MSIVETGLAFAEGLALIASPCILPILPLVLSASVEGGRKRPFGIIFGFVIAFTAFAMLSRKLVMALHINLDFIKYGSLILLAAFGLILLSESLSNKFSALTGKFANFGSTFSTNTKEGFLSGILIGMLIGLVWTPCAGPILAAVLVQVIRQENDIQAVILIASFAIGAGLPMLIISLMGKQIMNKLGFLKHHTEIVRKIFGFIILLTVGLMFYGNDIQANTNETKAASSNKIINQLNEQYQAPEFAGVDNWLNSQPLTMASLKGKVVLVDFWTYSCINCVRTLPYITEWDRKYHDKGLIIIGVHSPEFEFEKNLDNVKAALIAHNIKYPVALDNHLDTWTNFHNLYWPAHYLINRDGKVIYTHFGEGEYDITENNIRVLLGLDKTLENSSATQSNPEQTPETYLGRIRTNNFSSTEPLTIDSINNYTEPKYLPLHHWALSGKWQAHAENIVSQEPDAKLLFHFNSKKVFLVLGTKDKQDINIKIKLNGKEYSDIKVNNHKLYELINQPTAKEGVIEIIAEKSGLEGYAFTFGD